MEKIFPVFIYQSENGKANSFTENCIEQIVIESSFTPFKIKYVSVHGDSFYNRRFNYYFEKISGYIVYNQAILAINTLPGFQITDFLHALKNARSKLINKKIVLHPSSIDEFNTSK